VTGARTKHRGSRPGGVSRGARRAAATLCAATVLSLGGAHALALEVQITAVQALPDGPSDPRLLHMRPRLRRLVGYRAFRVLHEERRPCAWRSRTAFALPGGRFVQVVPKGIRREEVSMQVQVVEGPRELVDTDVRLQNRGVMLIGVDDRAPGLLLIMLRAMEPQAEE
jgi:hypothetical protein